ncbi:MAG TPA: TonB family protein [Candidatus Acidoferrales bacterium]|nr:TonB family protein [Candidatus Acidoferrales bacterium]
MTPLKETLEVGDAPVSGGASRPKPDSGQLRSDAVSLDVAVKVHGSRVVEVVRGTTPHTEPFEEQTSTMIVFPLGGVLKMTTLVSVGQAIVLTNLKTHQDAICRVVKIRTNPNLHSYVEVEFSHPQPGYWGVRFPSDGPEPPKKAASPSPAAGASIAPQPTAPPAAMMPVSTPAPKIEIPKIERKEQKTIPVAASIAPPPPPKTQVPVEAEKPAPAVAADSTSFSLDQLRGDSAASSATPFPSSARVEPAPHAATQSHSIAGPAAPDEPAAPETSTFGRFAASGEQLAARPAFGAGLEYNRTGSAAEKGESRAKNWGLIAAVVLLVAAAGGGGFYFLHKQPAAHIVAATTPATPQVPAQMNPTPNPVVANPASTQPTSAAVTPSAVVADRRLAAAPGAVPSRPVEANKVSKPAPVQPAETPNQAQKPERSRQNSAPVPDMFGALNAHPTAAVRSGGTEGGAAPAIETGTLAAQSVALPSTEPSPTNLAPPPPAVQPAPEGPLPIGGDVKAPQAISSPAVTYPEIARQAGVEGNVIVRIVIDKTGKVTDARALSGPMLLRDAAARSLRERRYAPPQLNGHPISVVMLVTIQFRR